MTLHWTLECDMCHKFLRPILSTASAAVYVEARLQKWTYHVGPFGIKKDICPRCQEDFVVMPEDDDIGDAIDNLLKGKRP